ATNALLATTYAAQSWTAAVPSGTLIGPGERWGVEIEIDVTANRYNAISTLAYDTGALQSRVLPVVNTVALSPTPSATPTRTPLSASTATATPCSYACDDFNRGTAAGLGAATSGGVWRARQRDTGSIGLCDSAACAATATGD